MLMYMYENEYDRISILWLWQKKACQQNLLTVLAVYLMYSVVFFLCCSYLQCVQPLLFACVFVH